MAAPIHFAEVATYQAALIHLVTDILPLTASFAFGVPGVVRQEMRCSGQWSVVSGQWCVQTSVPPQVPDDRTKNIPATPRLRLSNLRVSRDR